MMPAADRLLRLYPRAWRERYGDEFLTTVGPEPLNVQQIIDIVSGAIDAWLSADVQNATRTFHVASSGGRPTMLKSLMACEQRKLRYTRRDSLIGASVMVGGTLVFSIIGIAARRAGWPLTGDILLNVGFLGSLTLSMPFWLMKGQPWKAQVVIVGATFILLAASSYVASL